MSKDVYRFILIVVCSISAASQDINTLRLDSLFNIAEQMHHLQVTQELFHHRQASPASISTLIHWLSYRFLTENYTTHRFIFYRQFSGFHFTDQ